MSKRVLHSAGWARTVRCSVYCVTASIGSACIVGITHAQGGGNATTDFWMGMATLVLYVLLVVGDPLAPLVARGGGLIDTVLALLAVGYAAFVALCFGGFLHLDQLDAVALSFAVALALILAYRYLVWQYRLVAEEA